MPHIQKGYIIITCSNCDHVMKADTPKKRKLMERLHSKVCPNTGRTIDEETQMEELTRKDFKASMAYAVSKKIKVNVNPKSTFDNDRLNLISLGDVTKSMLKHS